MPAKILSEDDIVHFIQYAQTRNSEFALRDATIISISIFAGLRGAEIAVLKVNDITTPTGGLAAVLQVRKEGAKYGKARSVPIRPPLDSILRHYLHETKIVRGYLFEGLHGQHIEANALQQQYRRVAEEAGFTGVSSHSGRRTYITTLAHTVGKTNCTLVDVQLLAGHACLNSTESYIEPSGQEAQLVDQAFAGTVTSLVPSGAEDARPLLAASTSAGVKRGSQRSGGQTHYSRARMYRRKKMIKAFAADGDRPKSVPGDPENSELAPESPPRMAPGRWDDFLKRIVWRR